MKNPRADLKRRTKRTGVSPRLRYLTLAKEYLLESVQLLRLQKPDFRPQKKLYFFKILMF